MALSEFVENLRKRIGELEEQKGLVDIELECLRAAANALLHVRVKMPKGSLKDAVLRLLKERGPMTTSEIRIALCEKMPGVNPPSVASTVAYYCVHDDGSGGRGSRKYRAPVTPEEQQSVRKKTSTYQEDGNKKRASNV